MPLPFEVPFGEVRADLDMYVDEVFAQPAIGVHDAARKVPGSSIIRCSSKATRR